MQEGSIFASKPLIVAPLDPGFLPFVVGIRNFQSQLNAYGNASKVLFALERNGGLVSRFETAVFPQGSEFVAESKHYVERFVKFQLWSRGGWRIFVSGPSYICDHIAAVYRMGAARSFDVELMSRVFGHDFEVVKCLESELPGAKESSAPLGGHLDGCRVGFDLGASDYKLAALREGEVLFSTEIPWNPKENPDPNYHYQCISEGLRLAASKLPRVDAIGGSSAGIYIDNRVKVASLFRSVDLVSFANFVEPMFLNLRAEWKVPLEVANDGDVTALAGAMSLKKNAILGIAMGSSEAAGYLDRQGRITGWLNELAFAPVDLNPIAPVDEWSGDLGVGASYFSQQAVGRLLEVAGIQVEGADLPETLKQVQLLCDRGDQAAAKIFETIGVYLGYTLPLYSMFYDLDNVLILGRVTSGRGGEIIFEVARRVLNSEFPELSKRLALHVPDEHSRRVGQAVAAASLPVIKRDS